MTDSVQHYTELLETSAMDAESGTYLVVTGSSRETVAGALGLDLSQPLGEDDFDEDDVDTTAYAVAEVTGGILAIEWTGYGDPSNATLARLSAEGSAAVMRSNIQAHVRFGCARGGDLLFDDDEYAYIEDKASVPEELRALLDRAWVDLHADDDAAEDPCPVGLAMAEEVTGIRLTLTEVERVIQSGWFVAPSLVYRH